MSSSSSTIDILISATKHVNIYFGLFICVTGIIGGLLNSVVFTTLKTFRQTTCAFYLTIASIAGFAQSIIVSLRILNAEFDVQSLSTSIVCKLRFSLSQYCPLLSLTAVSMATIDQFLSMTNYRHLNNMRLARRHIVCASILWFIQSIFTFIYYDSNGNTCIITNAIFTKYYTYVYLPILLGALPITITTIFSLLAFFKIRAIASQQIDIVRLRRDRQLTAMTLIHALFIVLTTVPFVIFFTYKLSTVAKNAEEAFFNQFIYAITSLLACECYAVSSFILHRKLIHITQLFFS